jgi:hypothetical protein
MYYLISVKPIYLLNIPRIMINFWIMSNNLWEKGNFFYKPLMTISKLCTVPKINFVLWEQFVI